MWTSFAFWFPDTFDLDTVGAKNIHTAFIVKLPFRIRAGALRRLRIDSATEVVFRNKIDIPIKLEANDYIKLAWIDGKWRPYDVLCSEVMIIDRSPKTSDEEAKKLAAFAKDPAQTTLPEYSQRFIEAHQSLNAAIVAYHTATQHLFGGYIIERLTDVEFSDCLRHVHAIIVPADRSLLDDELVQVFDAKAEREFNSVSRQFSLDLADAPESDLAKLSRSLELHERFIFYQFALDAKSHMAQRDLLPAMLHAVVALEGAHAILLQLRLKARAIKMFQKEADRDKYAATKAEKLLLEVGLTEMIEMTSLCFLGESERPTVEEIEACKKGITIRNEIMHALTKRGQYRIRNRNMDDISMAYSSVLKMYDHFVGLIEKAELENESDGG
jgi:hypothetical protein